MDKLCNNLNWNGFAVSVIGFSHINKDLPCQDASLVVETPRAAAIVCDGRGSAKLSHFGAQAAVKAFQNQIAVFEPMLATILDEESVAPERWDMFSRIIYRTLAQSKQELVREYNNADITEREFDFTVACAITGKKHMGCFQVGDGAIVVRKDGATFTVFEPDKGEFANQTVFLRENGENKGKFHSKLIDSANVDGIAITSDGPECLMFKLPELVPSEVFNAFFDDMAAGNFDCQDLRNYLTRKKWSESYYGSDDRSVALLALQDAGMGKSDPCSESPAEHPVTTPEGEETQKTEKPEIGEKTSAPSKPELRPGTVVFPATRQVSVRSGKLKYLLAGVSLIAVSAISWGVSLHCQLRSLQKQLAVVEKSQKGNVNRIIEQKKMPEHSPTRQPESVRKTQPKTPGVIDSKKQAATPAQKEINNAGTTRSCQTK